MQYQTHNFRNTKEILNINTSETCAVFLFAGMEARETKTTMEYCWEVARQGVVTAAADQVPVRWGLDFHWTPLHTHT